MQRVSLPSRQPNQSLSLIRRGRRKERNEVFAALTKTAETECSEFLLTTPGCSAAGSARGLGPRCRRFESCHSDQRQNNTIRSPAAARRRPVDRWCCFSFPNRRTHGGPPIWLWCRVETLMGLLPFSVTGFECVIVTASGGYI